MEIIDGILAEEGKGHDRNKKKVYSNNGMDDCSEEKNGVEDAGKLERNRFEDLEESNNSKRKSVHGNNNGNLQSNSTSSIAKNSNKNSEGAVTKLSSAFMERTLNKQLLNNLLLQRISRKYHKLQGQKTVNVCLNDSHKAEVKAIGEIFEREVDKFS